MKTQVIKNGPKSVEKINYGICTIVSMVIMVIMVIDTISVSLTK